MFSFTFTDVPLNSKLQQYSLPYQVVDMIATSKGDLAMISWNQSGLPRQADVFTAKGQHLIELPVRPSPHLAGIARKKHTLFIMDILPYTRNETSLSSLPPDPENKPTIHVMDENGTYIKAMTLTDYRLNDAGIGPIAVDGTIIWVATKHNGPFKINFDSYSYRIIETVQHTTTSGARQRPFSPTAIYVDLWRAFISSGSLYIYGKEGFWSRFNLTIVNPLPSQGGITDLAVDNDSRGIKLYTLWQETNLIACLSENGKYINTVLSTKNGLKIEDHPSTIVFNQNVLYVTAGHVDYYGDALGYKLYVYPLVS